MKKIIYILVLLPMFVMGQTTTENYTKVTTYKGATATNPVVQVTYFDGLGRPIQQIANAQSNSGKNIITHMEYDTFGRQTKEYLPYKSDSTILDFVPNPLSGLLSYYSSPDPSVNGNPNQEATTNPYSEKEMEASPLNRVFKQAAPGDSWAMGLGHEIKMDYQANDSLEVKYFKATATWSSGNLSYGIAITDNGYYNKNELYKTVTKDENWTSGNDNTTQEFKNKEGQVVLKRTYNGEAYDTFYVYDQYGNLTYVLPPLAEANITQDVLDGLCYQYKYDGRNRLVAKKLPGKQWEFIVYDKQDKPVATGPAFSPWGDGTVGMMITEYDAFGRVTKTGWKALSVSESARSGWQGNVNGGSNPFVLGTNDILTKNYYDNYSYTNAPTLPSDIEGNNVATSVRGQATGSWVRILTTSTGTEAEESYTLYDLKYRPIRSHTKNYLGGYTQVDTQLDFMGKTLYTITRHKRTASDTEKVITDTFTYTAQDRLALHKQQIDILPEELIASNTYDELGQLVGKYVGGTVLDGTAGLQKVDYSYNIRGWLKSINDIKDDHSNLGKDPMDLFAFKLSYQDNDVTTHGAPSVGSLYNGNISESYWRTANDNVMRKYAYSYDSLNRLLNAAYSKPESAIYVDSYMEDILYDKNGNIQWMVRNGAIEDTNYVFGIDYLCYTYAPNSNKLMKVFDQGMSPQGFNEAKDTITNGNDVADDYTYDDNGNMTKDDNKGITLIKYNHLNLPTQISFENNPNKKITYLYDATGRKVNKTVNWVKTEITWGGGGEDSKNSVPTNLTPTTTYTNMTDVTDYLAGGFQYKNTFLQFMPHAEGYVDYTNGDPLYTFNYTDHLGNIRLSYRDDGSGNPYIVEETNYYPFGLRQEGYNSVSMTTIPWNGEDPNTNPNKYKYQGQELQDELGLNWDSFKWRNYDMAIGRFMSIDPLAEKYTYNSTYAFQENKMGLGRELEGLEVEFFPWLLGTSESITNTSTMLETAKTSIEVTGETAGETVTESHHVIPRQLKGDGVVEAAREDGFEFEGQENRVPVEKYSKATGEGRHGNHPSYNKAVGELLKAGPGKLTPVEFVRNLVSDLKTQIKNNPTTKINDLLKSNVVIDNTRIPKRPLPRAAPAPAPVPKPKPKPSPEPMPRPVQTSF